jgi:maltose O-acetyltransferase
MSFSRVETTETAKASRVLAYAWSHLVMTATSGLPDFALVMRLRGRLLNPCFRSCGRNVQIASGVKLSYTTSIDLGNDVLLANGVWVLGYGGVKIEDEVMVGPYTVIASSNHTKKDGSWRFGEPTQAPVSVQRGAWIGAHSVVTQGVTIGPGAVVAAGAVVTRNVDQHAVVGGVPAAPIGRKIKP